MYLFFVVLKGAPSKVVLFPAGNTSFNESDTLRLSCSSYGYPPPTLRWQRNNNDVVSSARIEISVTHTPYEDHQTQVNSTLQIAELLPNDDGSYECVASNEKGKNRASIVIEVRRELLVSEYGMNLTSLYSIQLKMTAMCHRVTFHVVDPKESVLMV